MKTVINRILGTALMVSLPFFAISQSLNPEMSQGNKEVRTNTESGEVDPGDPGDPIQTVTNNTCPENLFQAYSVKNVLYLLGNQVKDTQLQLNIYNVSGKLVTSVAIQPNGKQLNRRFSTNGFQTGVYIVKITGEKTSYTKRLFIS